MSKNLSQEQASMAVAVALQREVADLQRQLAEKTSEAKDMRSHYEWALAEIEAMRPMVERYKWLRSNDRAPSITGIWYGDFTLDKAIDEARKQP